MLPSTASMITDFSKIFPYRGIGVGTFFLNRDLNVLGRLPLPFGKILGYLSSLRFGATFFVVLEVDSLQKFDILLEKFDIFQRA